MITPINIHFSNNYNVGERAYLNPRFNSVSAKQTKSPSFTGYNFQRITDMNIGNMPEGFIGHVKLRNASNDGEYFAGVFKSFDCGAEVYKIKEHTGELLGEIKLMVNKYLYGQYDPLTYKEDPSHVFVKDLFNYSKKGTPYNNERLNEYKDIGVRALQIAQRRSDEAQCNGNIQLIAMPQAMDWYQNYIKMERESLFSWKLFLPPNAKERLSKLTGGL